MRAAGRGTGWQLAQGKDSASIGRLMKMPQTYVRPLNNHPCLPRTPIWPPCRVQLVSLCRFVGIQPFGTDAFLRSRLRRHLMEIKVGRGYEWLAAA